MAFNPRRVCSLLTLFLLGFPLYTLACTQLQLFYHERPPYQFLDPQGRVTGLLAPPVHHALQQLDIPYSWHPLPPKRQLVDLQDNQACSCGLGWFKNPSREQFARFSLPIYQDQAQIAIARASTTELFAGMPVSQALNSPLRLGVRDGYSYGQFIDTLIQQLKPPQESSASTNEQMLLKLQSGRIDYLFIAPEEARDLLELHNFNKAEFNFIYFADMPKGEKRYLMCTMQVTDILLQHLNLGIQAYHAEHPPSPHH